jgi:hypothetical protein
MSRSQGFRASSAQLNRRDSRRDGGELRSDIGLVGPPQDGDHLVVDLLGLVSGMGIRAASLPMLLAGSRRPVGSSSSRSPMSTRVLVVGCTAAKGAARGEEGDVGLAGLHRALSHLGQAGQEGIEDLR